MEIFHYQSFIELGRVGEYKIEGAEESQNDEVCIKIELVQN